MINAVMAGNRLLENGFELTEKNSNSMFRKSALDDDVTIDVTLEKNTFTVKIYEQLDADEFRDIAVFSTDYDNLGIDITKSIEDDGYSYTFRDTSSCAALSIR